MQTHTQTQRTLHKIVYYIDWLYGHSISNGISTYSISDSENKNYKLHFRAEWVCDGIAKGWPNTKCNKNKIERMERNGVKVRIMCA